MRSKEKVFFCLLLFLGFGALFLGFLKIRGGIYGPFWRPVKDKAVFQQPFDSASFRSESNRDTDKDGLSDFEETYVYKTSIYLPDTDSDDMSDKEEIEKGYDPLCPKGQDCSLQTESDKENIPSSASPVAPALGNEIQTDEIQTDGVSPEMKQKMTSDIENLTIDEIRNLLIQSGIDKETLDQVDDETLRKVYEETIKEVSN